MQLTRAALLAGLDPPATMTVFNMAIGPAAPIYAVTDDRPGGRAGGFSHADARSGQERDFRFRRSGSAAGVSISATARR